MLTGYGLEQKEKEADLIDTEHPFIIAGFSSFGSTLGRFLRANGVQASILDNDSDQVDLLRKMGFKVIYGDATRLNILYSAGAGSARILGQSLDRQHVGRNGEKTLSQAADHGPCRPECHEIRRSRNAPSCYHSQNDHDWDTIGPVTAAEESGLHLGDPEKGV